MFLSYPEIQILLLCFATSLKTLNIWGWVAYVSLVSITLLEISTGVCQPCKSQALLLLHYLLQLI